MCGGVKASSAGAGNALAVRDRPGSVGGTVGAVGAGGEDDDVVLAVNGQRRREGELLAAAAPALAHHRHGGLASRDQAGGRRNRALARLDLPRRLDESPGGLARLSLQGPRQHVGVETQLTRPRGRGLHDQRIVADDRVPHSLEDRITGLGRLRNFPAGTTLEPLHDAARRFLAQVEAVENGEGLGEGRDIRRGGTRSDHVERIADHVGEEQGLHAGRSRGAGELSSLEHGAVLPHGVELVDVGAGGQEQSRHRLLVGERDRRGGGRRQRRAAPRDQHEHEIVGRGRLGQRPDLSRGCRAALVGHGMARFEQPDAPRGGKVAVLDGDHAVGDARAPGLLDGRGHGARRLAGSHHEDTPLRRRNHGRERAQNERPHITGLEGNVEDGPGDFAKRQRRSFWSRRPASMSMSSVLGKQKRIFVRPSSLVE